MTDFLNIKEIKSNLRMYASPKQQEALKTNRYLQGFGEAASELFSSIDGYQLDFKIIISDYAEGRYDFLKSWNHLKAKMSEEEINTHLSEFHCILQSIGFRK